MKSERNNSFEKNSSNNTVYISNLSYQRDRNGLRSMFSRFGKILNIKIIVEPATNQSRGMAFIEMSNAIEARNAIEGLNQRVFDGRTVKVSPAIPMKKISVSRLDSKEAKSKDLSFQDIQLAKKARNEARRKSNPLVFKLPSKKA